MLVTANNTVQQTTQHQSDVTVQVHNNVPSIIMEIPIAESPVVTPSPIVMTNNEVVSVSSVTPTTEVAPASSGAVTSQSIATRREGFEIVSEILKHRGSSKNKNKMSFKVRWENFDATHDSWLPWKNLRDNAVLHVYLQSHGLCRSLFQQYIVHMVGKLVVVGLVLISHHYCLSGSRLQSASTKVLRKIQERKIIIIRMMMRCRYVNYWII